MASSCTHKEASFESLDDLNNTFVLLDKDNDLEQKKYSFMQWSKYFYFQIWKNPATNQALNILKRCTVN